jgi:hypothetical protein
VVEDRMERMTEPDAGPPLNRMIAAVLALIGVLISTYMLLYHFGVIGSIVCGTGGCRGRSSWGCPSRSSACSATARSS